MKKMFLSFLIFVMSIIIIFNSAYASPQTNLEDLYKSHELVLFGKVISREDGPGSKYYYYHVIVEEYYKNPKTYDMITIAGPKEDNPRSGDQVFEVGDKAIFFLKKIDNVYVISSSSIKSDIGCSGKLLINLSKIPNEKLERGSPSHTITFTDIDGNSIPKIHTNDDILINFDGWNQIPMPKSSNFTLYIYDENKSLLFNNTKQINFDPCSFKSMSWNYQVPPKSGNYFVDISSDNVSTSMSFQVYPTNSAVSLDKTVYPIIDSPLKQFKSGLASADVFCKGNLTLVIKTSTGSPACVKPEHVKRLLANGWFSVPPSDRAIRPLVTVIDNEENLGIVLTEMKIISKQNYDTLHGNNLKVSTFQGNLSGIPTVVSKIINVSNQKIMLNQVLITGSIILSADSTMTPMYADVIGCSISHQEDGDVTCPYPTAVYEPIELEPNEYFVSYFSDDFAHKLGPINKIATSVWYDLESVDSPHHQTEIDSLLELEK